MENYSSQKKLDDNNETFINHSYDEILFFIYPILEQDHQFKIIIQHGDIVGILNIKSNKNSNL